MSFARDVFPQPGEINNLTIFLMQESGNTLILFMVGVCFCDFQKI